MPEKELKAYELGRKAGIDEAVEVIKTMYKDISGDVLSATGFPEAVDYGYNQALDDTIKALQDNK